MDTGTEIDPADLAGDVDALESSQRRLVEHLRSLDEIDPATPSRLPEWSVGHVLSHIAPNGDSILRMLAGLPQYWKGWESRTADIELGATRPWSELVDDVESTSAAVVRRMREITDWTGSVRAASAERPKAVLPHLRRREVEVHHTDLGLGYGFADLPGDFVRKETRLLEMLWKARQPMGLTPLPDPVLRLPEYARLEWLIGRREVEGVAPAAVMA